MEASSGLFIGYDDYILLGLNEWLNLNFFGVVWVHDYLDFGLVEALDFLAESVAVISSI